jgi:hypothetical protein
MGTHRSHCAHIYMWRLGKRSSKRDQHQRRSDRSSIIDQGLFVTNIKSICYNCHGNVELQVDLILIDASGMQPQSTQRPNIRASTSQLPNIHVPERRMPVEACAHTRRRWDKPTHVTQSRKIQIQITTLPAVPGHHKRQFSCCNMIF